MNSLQPTGGRARSVYTGIFLTALISLSLIGALAVQLGNGLDNGGSRTGIAAKNGDERDIIQEGLLARSTPSTPEPEIVRSRDYGLWSYVAMRAPTGLTVDLSYKYETEPDLDRYVVMNQERAAKLASAGGEVDTLVTFRWPISPEQFRLWAKNSGMEVASVSLRLSPSGGVPGTLTIRGRHDDPLPEDALRRGQKKLPPIEGVYSVRGKIAAVTLPEITSNQDVFLADVTPTLTRSDLIDSGIQGAQEATIYCESPYEMVEKLKR